MADRNLLGLPADVDPRYANNLLSVTPTRADAAQWHGNNLLATWQAMQNPQTWVDAASQYGNALLMGSTAPRGVRIWHGSTENFAVPDLGRTGTGAMSGKVTSKDLPPAFYAVSEKGNAEPYGDPMQFEISSGAKIKRIDAKRQLEDWAQDNGFESAQDMLTKYYEGSLYRAYDIDTETIYQLRQAQKEGHSGIAFDFGDLVHSDGGSRKPGGTFYVISDPSVLTRVKD